MSHKQRVDAENGVIYGVCVISEGEAKGHGVQLDRQSLETFLALTKDRPDGVGTRFGDDHEAGAQDFNGTLKNFRLEESRIKADLYLLKSDKNYAKLLEMAEKMANEFGLSAVADAEKTAKSDAFKSPLRFTALDCVDIVSSPAATNGLFFSTKTNNMKNIAIALGLPETATEQEIIDASKLALECKKKMEEDKKGEEKKELDADDAAAGKDAKKKLETLEATVLKLSQTLETINQNSEAAKASAHKAEIENLKLEASKDGKVIPLTDEALVKLSIAEIKETIAKLPKGQVKLSKGNQPVNKEGKAIDKNSPEFRAYLAEQKQAGAIALSRHFTNK